MEPVALNLQYISTACFLLAVIHTFFSRPIRDFAERFPQGSFGENIFHLLGEVEIVFGLWAGIFLSIWSFFSGTESAARYLSSVNFSEAGFVFVVMCMAATKPVLNASERLVKTLAGFIPGSPGFSIYLTAMTVGPLLGSLITEPATMTVIALMLRDRVLRRGMRQEFLYASLGLLFVNVSIGGTLSHFAAPPVVMVAHVWDWGSWFMMKTFGWKAILSVFTSTFLTAWYFKRDLDELEFGEEAAEAKQSPLWLILSHFLFLGLVIFHSHYLAFCLGLFFFFLGWCTATKEHQDEIRIREGLLVGFFLAGLVTLGKLQSWWLEPLLKSMDSNLLFWGATGLTAFTDNAALTYLGTLVPDLGVEMRYSLVAGAVVGGGLTVIANAPNPVGYSLLGNIFGDSGIKAFGLFLGALIPTVIASIFFLAF